MARNERLVDAPVESVWEVLSDGFAYADWVVGARTIRRVEGDFPTPGARLHYRIGLGPVHFDDHTEVCEVLPLRRLLLSAQAWPMGAASIDIRTEAVGSRTRVVMDEEPTEGLGRVVHNPLLDLAVKARNVETLRRLERLAKRRLDARGTLTAPPDAGTAG